MGRWYLKNTDTGKIVLAEHFTGPMEFASFCAANAPESEWKNKATSAGPQRKWNGAITWDDAIKMCMNGWRNGWEDVVQDMVTIEDDEKPIRPRTSLNPGFHGSRPSISRYIMGLPKHMIKVSRPRVNAPAVKLIISIGALSNVDAESYKRRGAAVCAYVDAVETAGISTEIIALSRAQGGTTRGMIAEVSVQLKSPGQPLDIDAVAFCLGHPAMLRRLVFRWREKDIMYKDFYPGYGRSRDPEEENGSLRICTMKAHDNNLSTQDWYDKISTAVAQERLTL